MTEAHANAPTARGDLAGRVAIVTGGGSRTEGIGNGRAASVLLARRGAAVLVTDVEVAAAADTVAMIKAEGGQALEFRADVSVPADCEAAVAAAVERWGRVDILVNNVGIGGPPGTAVDVDLEAWDHAMRVNVTSMMLMARFSVPVMARQGKGAIVNIASVAGIAGAPRLSVYAAAKHGVVGLTRSAAAEYATKGVRINAVCPSFARTAMVEKSLPAAEEDRKASEAELVRGVPMRRLAEVDEIVEVILFAASPENGFMTGQTLAADGGITSI